MDFRMRHRTQHDDVILPEPGDNPEGTRQVRIDRSVSVSREGHAWLAASIAVLIGMALAAGVVASSEAVVAWLSVGKEWVAW